MKNHEEFRNAVFEKAERYEAKRRARNKKIAEITCLCSLAFVIALSAYLGVFPSLNDEILPTETSTDPSTTQNSLDFSQNETIQKIETTTATTELTTTATIPQGTTSEETITTPEWTSTATETFHSVQTPINSKLEFRASAKDSDFAVGKTLLTEIETYEEWLAFLAEHTDDYPALEQSDTMPDELDEDYFAEHTLVIIQYAGYDIIAFGSELEPADVDEKYTLYINLRTNRANSRKQIHIMSVDKASYKDAQIRIWNNSEN